MVCFGQWASVKLRWKNQILTTIAAQHSTRQRWPEFSDTGMMEMDWVMGTYRDSAVMGDGVIDRAVSIFGRPRGREPPSHLIIPHIPHTIFSTIDLSRLF